MTSGTAGIDSSLRGGRSIRAGYSEGAREETSLLAFLSILLTHRRVIALCTLAGTLVFGILAAAKADLYVSRVAFIVKGTQTPVQLPGGAAAFGVSLSAYAEFSQAVSFFTDLARSGTVLKNVAAQSYATSDSKGVKRPLAEIYGIREKNPALSLELAARQLGEDLVQNLSSRTGVVRLAVQAKDPLLAQELATSVLAELNRWSSEQGHQQAVLERNFMEQLVGDAKVKMDQAEQSVSTFLALNREYESSPQLKLEHERLTRDVLMRQQIYTALAQSLEQAKIEEVRSPTILRVVDTANLPVEPQRREAVRQTLFGMAAGLLAGIIFAMIGQRMEEKRVA